jgi:D-alanine-D-alanine ligase
MIDDLRRVRIGILMGGLSSEREVSLSTGKGVHEALSARGWDCVAIDWKERGALPAQLAEAGVGAVWNALHGTFGEDGAVQGLLACLGIPYTGSGVLASALAMDKVASKRLFESQGIATPEWRLIEIDEPDPARALANWELPLVVKPAREGSSVGVTIVHDAGALAGAVALARSHRGPTIVERYIAGGELHVGILDDTVLGSIEVRPAGEFYDYSAKYSRGDTQYIIPPTIAAGAVARAQANALDAWRSLSCSGHGRIDLRITEAGDPFVLEVNTLPGMTPRSLLPKIAAHAGMDYGTLCERILAGAHVE